MRPRKEGSKDFDPITQHVARRLTERRHALGMVTEHLAALLGVSQSSAGRYETGETAIAAPMLYRLCVVLHCPPGYFFEGLAARPARLMNPGLSAEGAATFEHLRPVAPAIAEIGARARRASIGDQEAFVGAAEKHLTGVNDLGADHDEDQRPISTQERIARLCIAGALDDDVTSALSKIADKLLPSLTVKRHKQF